MVILFIAVMSLTTQKPCLTVRHTSQTGLFTRALGSYFPVTKVCGSEPALWCGSSVDKRIKGTPGITG